MGLFNLFGKSNNQIREFLNEGAIIIDVRTPREFNSGHIKGSKNIPLDTLRHKVEEIRRYNKPVITVCHSGMRSGSAKSFLQENGIKVVNGGSWVSLNNIA